MIPLQHFKRPIASREEPCLVCGTGPSITDVMGKIPLELQTIAVNKADYYITPTQLVILDPINPVNHKLEHHDDIQCIMNTRAGFVFAVHDLERGGQGLKIAKQVKITVEAVLASDIDRMYHRDILPCCNTSTFTALTLAIYEGYKSIGVIGFDIINHPTERSLVNIDAGCLKLNEWAKKKGIQIVNLSKLSKLQTFERMDYMIWIDTYYYKSTQAGMTAVEAAKAWKGAK